MAGAAPYKDLHPTQRRFLLAFEACNSIVKASRWAKVHRCNHYDWMEKSDYSQAFKIAEDRAIRTMEDEAVRRAHDGVRQAVFYKGKIVGWKTEYSDTLMLAVLKAGKPDKYRERSAVELTGRDGTPLFPLTELDRLLHGDGNTESV